MKLFLATHNRNKIEEIRGIFAFPGLEILSPSDLPVAPAEVEENADTFEGNALLKARSLADAAKDAAGTPCWVMADDSGLEVAALNGEPGVRSARYAGEPSNTPANNAKLLRALEGVEDRRARFVCAIAFRAPDGREWTVRGECPGRILRESRGVAGFGYDPLFVPDGYGATFAELGPSVKNKISHRALALEKALALFGAELGKQGRGACLV